MTILPRTPVPPLVLETVGGPTFDLQGRSPEHFTVLIFYRGFH